MLIVGELIIPQSELEITYARSSGPGGQNVNKVNSKAVLRWSVASSGALTEELRFRLLSRLASRLTTAGEIVISSDRFRDQGRNREDCFEKLRELLASALRPTKHRTKTKPTRSSKRRNSEAKKHHSEKKRLRRSRADD